MFVGRRRVLLLGVAGDQGGVDIQDEAGQFASACAGGRYRLPPLVGLQPGDLAGCGTARAQSAERGRIDARQQSPRGGIGRDGAEDLGLVPQQGQVGDCLPAVGQHHSQVHCDPAGGVTGAARSQLAQRVREGRGQAGGIGEIGQQPGPGMADHRRLRRISSPSTPLPARPPRPNASWSSPRSGAPSIRP